MNQKTCPRPDTLLLALLGGAVLGAVAVALALPESRRRLRSLASHLRRRAPGDPEDDGLIQMLFI